MPSHTVRWTQRIATPRSCRIEPNFVYRKLCWIYCVCLKILLNLFYLIGKFCCPLFCNFSVWRRLIWLLKCYLFYISYQTLSLSQSWNWSWSWSGAWSQNSPTTTLHHLVSWYLLSICPSIMPLHMWLSCAQSVGMPMGRHTVVHTLIYFNSINTFYIMLTRTWHRSPRQTKKRTHPDTDAYIVSHKK